MREWREWRVGTAGHFFFFSCDIERVSGCMGYSGTSTVPAV